jgi:hypothetical protein
VVIGILVNAAAELVGTAESAHRFFGTPRTERILKLARAIAQEVKALVEEGKAKA